MNEAPFTPQPEQEPKPPTQGEVLIKALAGFPIFLFRNIVGTIIGALLDWDTFLLFAGAAVLAYATGAYLIVGAALLLIYALIRIVGDMVNAINKSTQAASQNFAFVGQVLRDNWQVEHRIAVSQMPGVVIVRPPEDGDSEPTPG